MSTVKVKAKRQMTLPAAIAERVGLSVGDLLEASIEGGNIVLKPKSPLDLHIGESIDQIRAGQFYGPFDTADDAIEALHKNSQHLAGSGHA
jgi:AbrB family looped-hinge helix DNA binding protein